MLIECGFVNLGMIKWVLLAERTLYSLSSVGYADLVELIYVFASLIVA